MTEARDTVVNAVDADEDEERLRKGVSSAGNMTMVERSRLSLRSTLALQPCCNRSVRVANEGSLCDSLASFLILILRSIFSHPPSLKPCPFPLHISCIDTKKIQ